MLSSVEFEAVAIIVGVRSIDWWDSNNRQAPPTVEEDFLDNLEYEAYLAWKL